MDVLVIGSGGREHALAWKIAQSADVKHVFVAPGNAGTNSEPHIENVAIDVLNIKELIAFAKNNAIALTVVGPEAPLAAGIVDAFAKEQLPCFGPKQAAAQLESSKRFSKEFMIRHHIPTAAFECFADPTPAKAYVEKQTLPIVIKADGLAAGKGVIIAQTQQEAFDTIDDMLTGHQFGDAGARIVIEEFLVGEEASFMTMVDGKHILPLATSQDHKARDNGDLGPNTGGMGAYSPAPVVTPELHHHIMETIIKPTVQGLAEDSTPYTGFLYAGLMISKTGEAKVLEYNCRLGDPETQPILFRLKSDLAALCLAAIDQTLDQCTAEWDPRTALGVVLCAGGYPAKYDKGQLIEGLANDTQDSKVFHAGTRLHNQQVVTHGGRVLCATALGNTIKEAQTKAYQLANKIHWNKVYFRTDIGYKAIAKEQQKEH